MLTAPNSFEQTLAAVRSDIEAGNTHGISTFVESAQRNRPKNSLAVDLDSYCTCPGVHVLRLSFG